MVPYDLIDATRDSCIIAVMKKLGFSILAVVLLGGAGFFAWANTGSKCESIKKWISGSKCGTEIISPGNASANQNNDLLSPPALPE